ncbi:MAG TPA: hypothetical protein VF507_10780, partial [Pyrinomonadaceae bacterium]|jgi:hypothetical protein
LKIAKAYLLAHLLYSVTAFLLPLTAGLGSQGNWLMLRLGAKGLVRSLVYVAVCYVYLNSSERVKATYAEDAGDATDVESSTLNPGG